MYCVVHVDTWFATVPEIWVDKVRKVVRWPCGKGLPISAMIKKQIPYKSDWTEFHYVCVFGPFGK